MRLLDGNGRAQPIRSQRTSVRASSRSARMAFQNSTGRQIAMLSYHLRGLFLAMLAIVGLAILLALAQSPHAG